MPQQASWPQTLATLLPALLAPIAAALPPGCQVTLLGDRGVAGPTLIDAAQAQGWDVVLRLNVGPTQAHRLRLVRGEDGRQGEEWRLWDWVETVSPGWSGAVQIDPEQAHDAVADAVEEGDDRAKGEVEDVDGTGHPQRGRLRAL